MDNKFYQPLIDLFSDGKERSIHDIASSVGIPITIDIERDREEIKLLSEAIDHLCRVDKILYEFYYILDADRNIISEKFYNLSELLDKLEENMDDVYIVPWLGKV